MRKDYVVTEKAGPFVAGTRNPGKGGTLRLTEDQARYALIAGEIEPATKTESTKPAAKGVKGNG
jgi:hypothetical protein